VRDANAQRDALGGPPPAHHAPFPPFVENDALGPSLRHIFVVTFVAILIFVLFKGGVITTDIARGKAVTMSSIYNSKQFPGSALVDGDWGTICHTNWEHSPSVGVDLLSKRQIWRIVIVNRDDCCQDRLGYFTVQVDGKIIGSYHYTALTGSPPQLHIETDIVGREVRVQLKDSNSLHLGALEVYSPIVSWSDLTHAWHFWRVF